MFLAELYNLYAVMGTDINLSIGSLVTWSESKVDLWLRDKEDPGARTVVPFVLNSDLPHREVRVLVWVLCDILLALMRHKISTNVAKNCKFSANHCQQIHAVCASAL